MFRCYPQHLQSVFFQDIWHKYKSHKFTVSSWYNAQTAEVRIAARFWFIWSFTTKMRKAKLSLCLTEHRAMKAYWGAEV
jgi:hypothetical protein